ncbi:MAG TPA: Uma2 family endonuclease [Chloroflexota bacterium]|nr:Uma2 family endonuclease [Chloroflexota bacterium]
MVTDLLVAPWAEPVPETARRQYTVDDLAVLPEDGWTYELVEGSLVRMPPPKPRHGHLEALLAAALFAESRVADLGRVYVGETGFDLTLPGEAGPTILGADVAFVRAERLTALIDEDAYFPGAPDLVVEIASPSQFRPVLGAKAWLWLRRGARLVWVVWPRQQEIDVWTPGQETPRTLRLGDAVEGGDVLPGFTLSLADLFA